MNFPASFKTEDERISTMEAYRSEEGSDPSGIDQIMQIPVETPDPEPVEEVEEAQPEAAPAPEGTPEPAPSAAAPEPAAPAKPAASEPRNWTITEEDIPQDEYFDTKEQRTRKFITHKNPQDLFKTLISGQKRIHYLEDILLPQERRAAQEEARRATQQEIASLKAEVERLKEHPASQAPAQPPQAPAAGGASAAPSQPQNLQGTSQKLSDALTELKAIDPKDSVEHTDKMQTALMAALEQVSALTGHISTIQQESRQLGGKFQTFETQSKQAEERRAAEAKAQQGKQDWQNACRLIDTFATTNGDFKKLYPSTGQSFEDMTRESVTFHAELAGLMFNKSPNAVTNTEQMEASQAYLRGDQNLIQKATQYGINEPRNYRAWVELDQVDAMRGGLYRDPVSKKWIQLHDPVTRQPVRLGDMETAYGRYLDVSGKRAEMTNELLKKERENMTNALGRRDTSLASMDGAQARSDGSGAEMTEQQAIQITEEIDPQGAMTIYMRSGGTNRASLDKLNSALQRLGLPQLEVPELDYANRPKVAGQ